MRYNWFTKEIKTGSILQRARFSFSENALISKRTVYRNFEEGVYNLAVLQSGSGLSRIIRVEDSGGQEKGRKGGGRQRKRIGTGLITLKILYTDKLAASPCR